MVEPDASPRLVAGLGDVEEARVRVQAELEGHGVGGEAAQQLGLAYGVEDLLDLPCSGGEPAGPAGGQDELLDLEELGVRDGFEVREIEAHAVGGLRGAGLANVGAEDFAERPMDQMRGGVMTVDGAAAD